MVIVAVAISGVTQASANCSEIVKLPMTSTAITQAKDGTGVICEWRTEMWVPSKTCGAFGFEAAGPGTMVVPLIFKRSNTLYLTHWKPQVVGDGWSTASLGPENRGHRCFAGWCTSVSYILRTGLPVEEAVCANEVELRVRLEARAE